MNKDKLIMNKDKLIMNKDKLMTLTSSGIRRNWQQSNLSTLELCTRLPSRPMSACPSPHGDTLRDGKIDFDHYMIIWNGKNFQQIIMHLQPTLSKVWQDRGGHCAYQPLLANQQEPCHHSQVPCESTSWCPPVMKHCQRHNGPEGWVHLTKVTPWGHITSSNTNLDQISEFYQASTSKSQPNISILTKS